MEHDSGSGVITTINFQVASVSDDETIYFGQGDSIFGLKDEDTSNGYDSFEGNIPVGNYLTLSDINRRLLTDPKMEIDTVVKYYNLVKRIAYLGVILADSLRYKINTLTIAGSGKTEVAINYWGDIKKFARLWFILLPVLHDNKIHTQIVPYSCQACPPMVASFSDFKSKTFNTMREDIKQPVAEDEKKLYFIYSMYAGRCEDPGTVVLSQTTDYASLVPDALLLKKHLSSHKSCLSSAHRLSMLVDGRPDL